MGGVVKLADVSDFITPSQACILPMPGHSDKPNSSLVKLRDKSKKPVTKPDEKIMVTLKDCLACSGCVTTAETVLIQSQTAEEMLSGLSSGKIGFVTVSPQALASLAAELDMSVSDMAVGVTRYFKARGASYVIDSSFGRYFSLMESLTELKTRLESQTGREMLISGICPGFVCYAEKRKQNDVVPLISSIRSPQAITGALIKDFLVRKMNLDPRMVYHVALMPCYDKKLEASRADFSVNGVDVQETDCVVTPSELLPLLKEFEYDGRLMTSGNEINWLNSLEFGEVIGDYEGETSGGYTRFILDALIRMLKENSKLVEVKTESQNDLERFTLNLTNGQSLTLLKAYGFRNIQNLVRRIQQRKNEVDYVEVMACPKGCLNGGGQIRNPEPALQDQRVLRVKDVYKQATRRDLLESEYFQVRKEWENINPSFRDLLIAKIKHVEGPATNTVAAMAW